MREQQRRVGFAQQLRAVRDRRMITSEPQSWIAIVHKNGS